MRSERLSILAFFSACLVHSVESAEDAFSNPPSVTSAQDYSQNPVFYLGLDQTIAWTTSYSSYNITLSQQNLSDESLTNSTICSSNNVTNGASSSYIWNVSAGDVDLAQSPVFFLSLSPLDGSAGFRSSYFNISTPDGSRTQSPDGSSSTPSDSAPSSSQTPTHPAIDVGIGAGIGVGVPVVLVAGIWLGFKLAKQRKSAKVADAEQYQAGMTNTYYWPGHSPSQEHMREAASRDIYEAPAYGNWAVEAPLRAMTPERSRSRNPSVGSR